MKHPTDRTRVLPIVPRYTEEPFQMIIDINSYADRNYPALLKRYPLADGARDIGMLYACNVAEIDGMFAAVRRGEMTYACIGWLLFIHYFCVAARKQGKTPVEYADWLYDRCATLNKEVGYRAAWMEGYGEIGNSIFWPANRAFSKREALAYFRAWMRGGHSLSEHWMRCQAREIFPKGSPLIEEAHRRLVPEEALCYYTHALTRDRNLRNLPIYYTDAVLIAIHEAFRLGFPMVCYEAACGSSNPVQAGIAFTRGGAKTFDGFWGVDLSPWDGALRGEVTEVNNSGAWRSGFTVDNMRRIWLTAYLSGANIYIHESGYTFFHLKTPAGDLIPSEYGFAAMQFHHWVNDALRDRGRCVTPFAVMLEEEHGYRGDEARIISEDGAPDTAKIDAREKRLSIWCGRAGEATVGDWQVHRLLQTLWPLPHNAWEPWTNDRPDAPLSALSDPAAVAEEAARLRSGEVDPRAFGRYLNDSRWADCVDVIIEDAPEESLAKHYRVILLAGDIRTDNGLWDRLCRFVEGGGEVVLAPEQMDETARAWFGPNGGNMVREAPRGKGLYHLLPAGWGLDAEARTLHPSCLALLDRLMWKHLGVRRVGPACQLIVNRRNEDVLITLFNHTLEDWRGAVEVRRDLYPPIVEVRDLLADRALPVSRITSERDAVGARVRVPALGFRIFSFGPARRDAPFRLPDTRSFFEEEANREHKRRQYQEGAERVIGTADRYMGTAR